MSGNGNTAQTNFNLLQAALLRNSKARQFCSSSCRPTIRPSESTPGCANASPRSTRSTRSGTSARRGSSLPGPSLLRRHAAVRGHGSVAPGWAHVQPHLQPRLPGRNAVVDRERGQLGLRHHLPDDHGQRSGDQPDHRQRHHWRVDELNVTLSSTDASVINLLDRIITLNGNPARNLLVGGSAWSECPRGLVLVLLSTALARLSALPTPRSRGEMLTCERITHGTQDSPELAGRTARIRPKMTGSTMQALVLSLARTGSGSPPVTQIGTPAMSVQVATGWGAVAGNFQANMGVYPLFNDAANALTVTAERVGQPAHRPGCSHDQRHLLHRSAEQRRALRRCWHSGRVPGRASHAHELNITGHDLAVANGAASILNANITDTRVAATSNSIHLTQYASLTGTQTVSNKTLTSPEETWAVSATAATGTINYDCGTQGVLYYTTAASANFTPNFRWSGAATLASILPVGTASSASRSRTPTPAQRSTQWCPDRRRSSYAKVGRWHCTDSGQHQRGRRLHVHDRQDCCDSDVRGPRWRNEACAIRRHLPNAWWRSRRTR